MVLELRMSLVEPSCVPAGAMLSRADAGDARLVVIVYAQLETRPSELSLALHAACAAGAATVILAPDVTSLATWQSWAGEDGHAVLRAVPRQRLGRGQIHLMAPSDRLSLSGHQFFCRPELTSATSLMQPPAGGLDYCCIALVPSRLLEEVVEALQTLREHGGLMFGIGNLESDPQAPVPAASICDSVLSVAELCAFFQDYRQARETTYGTLETPGMATHLPAILWLLTVRTGREFSRSGNAVLVREIWSRLQVLGLQDIASYLQLLQDDARECELLSRTLSGTAPRFSIVPRYSPAIVRPSLSAHDAESERSHSLAHDAESERSHSPD